MFVANTSNAQTQNTDIELQSASFNTSEAEFSAVYVDNDIIYVSDKKSSYPINRYNSENGRYFCQFYTDSKDDIIKSLVKKLNTKFHEGQVCLNSDKTLAFYTKNLESKKLGIFYMKYEDGKWSDEIAFDLNNEEYSTGHPCFDSEEKYLYYVSDKPGGKGQTDIYRVLLNPDDWGTPENVEAVNTKSKEMFPFINEKNELIFSSYRSGGIS